MFDTFAHLKNDFPESALYWECCYKYVLVKNVVILVDLHSQKWINTLLFELVVTCINTHIFAPIISTSHIFISIIMFSVISYS